MAELHPQLQTFISALQGICPRLLFNEPMSKHTTFRIGGPAALVVYPQDIQQLTHMLALHHDICPTYPLCILGRGSNVLFDDEGYNGLVIITTHMQSVRMTQDTPTSYTVTADCGVLLKTLAKQCCDHTPSLSGLAFAYGIPGTLGGGVVMNAGAYGGEMADVVTSVDYYDPKTQSIHTASKDALDFAYRHSLFEDKPHLVVLSVTLSLPVGEHDVIDAEMKKNMEARREKQPLNFPNAGSVFKRPTQDGCSVGKMVEDCGLKGYTIGGAQVSEKHGGFIVNAGGATAADVRQLIHHIKSVIHSTYGISLVCEIRHISHNNT